MKPGIKTTEFWLTLGAQIIPILVLLGVFTSEEGLAAQEAWVKLIETVFAAIASVVPIAMYIYSRTKIKS